MLNVGGVDNPIRGLVDINDLQAFNLNPTQAKVDPLRETYNSLLRSLSELKDCYYSYRAMLPNPKTDPFILSAGQFWVFLRDHDLISPQGCTLAKINRTINAGERTLSEAAPDALDEVEENFEKYFGYLARCEGKFWYIDPKN